MKKLIYPKNERGWQVLINRVKKGHISIAEISHRLDAMVGLVVLAQRE